MVGIWSVRLYMYVAKSNAKTATQGAKSKLSAGKTPLQVCLLLGSRITSAAASQFGARVVLYKSASPESPAHHHHPTRSRSLNTKIQI